MRLIQDLLEDREHEVVSVTPESTVYEAINLMDEQNTGAVAVLDGDRLAGIFTERDYARKLLLMGRSSMRTHMKVTMSPDVVFVRPQQSVEECMALMMNKRIRHLPVLDGERLVGLISIEDLVRAMISVEGIEEK